MLTLPVVRGKAAHRATTYAELKFERGIVSYCWHWWNGEFYEQHEPKAGLQLTILQPFRQQSANEFVTYHIFMSVSLRIRFEFESDRKTQSMPLVMAEGELKAARF